MRNLLYVFIVVTMVAIGCKPSVPSRYIQPEEMEDILYDYFVAQAMARQSTQNEYGYRSQLYFQAVLKKHQITEADFDSSLVYYYGRSEKFKEVFHNLKDRISNDALSLGASIGEINRYSQYSSNGDTANIWSGPTSEFLFVAPPYNRLSFEQKIDTAYHRGDSFLFNFETIFLYQSGTKDGVACVLVGYDNDSVATFTTSIFNTGLSQVRIPGDTLHNIRSMKGFIYLDRGNEQTQSMKLMWVNKLQLVRFHDRRYKK